MGGYGYVYEQQVERLTRDAKLLMIGGGTSEIQLLNIAKDLARDKGINLSLAGGLQA
jgi:alkylation response protein AidB-like acyl-CoA dehydrogenase